MDATAGGGILSRHLPELYRTDDFLLHFLEYYEALLADLDSQINQLHLNLDPATAPVEMLDWLSGWVGVELDASLPKPGRRNLLRRAIAQAYQRGTKRGLRESLAAALCLVPDAVTVTDRPTEQTPSIQSHHILVEIDMSRPLVHEAMEKLDTSRREILRQQVQRIIEAQKPAHTYCDLKILPGTDQDPKAEPK